MSFLRDSATGNLSSMRLLALLSFALGCVLAVGGLVGWFLGLSAAPTIIATGAGIAGAGDLAKALQRKWEVPKP